MGYVLAETDYFFVQPLEFIADLVVLKSGESTQLGNLPESLTNNDGICTVSVGIGKLARLDLGALQQLHEHVETNILGLFTPRDIERDQGTSESASSTEPCST